MGKAKRPRTRKIYEKEMIGWRSIQKDAKRGGKTIGRLRKCGTWKKKRIAKKPNTLQGKPQSSLRTRPPNL